MAANVLGLFLLIVAGISNVLSYDFVLEKKFRDTYNPWLDYRGIKSPYMNNYQNYLRSYRGRQRLRNAGIVNYFDYFQETSPSNKFINPVPTDVPSQSNTHTLSSESVNFASELYVTGQKVSDFKESPETSKNIPDTDFTSNPVISQTVYKIPLKRQPESLSLLKKEDLHLIDDKSSFTTLENTRKGDTIESSMDSKILKGASEFLTDTFTKREGTDSSFKDKRKDQIDEVTFPKGDSVTPNLETKEKCGCQYLCMKTNALQKLFKKSNEADFQAESTMLQKSSSVITPKITPLIDLSVSSDSTETTKNQKSDMFTNEEKIESKSTRFEDTSSTKEIIPLGDKSSFSVNTEMTYSKDSKMKTTISQSSSVTTDGDIDLKIKSSSSEEIHSTNTQNFETESTVAQPLSTVTNDDTTLQTRLSSSEAIHSTNTQIFETESTVSEPLSTNDDTALQTRLSSSEAIHSTSTQNLETESTVFHPLSTVTSEDTELPSRLSSSFETKSTAFETSEIQSTTENFISSSTDASVSFKNKVTEDVTKETFHTESTSSEVHFTSGNIKQDHVIEIPSIHKARIVITSLFLVIALTALTVLAVYMFTLRRKTVHYDQLQLIS